MGGRKALRAPYCFSRYELRLTQARAAEFKIHAAITEDTFHFLIWSGSNREGAAANSFSSLNFCLGFDRTQFHLRLSANKASY